MTIELRHDGKIKLTNFSFHELLDELQPYIKQGYSISFENEDFPVAYSGCYVCVVFLEQPDASLETALEITPEVATNEVNTPVKTTEKRPQKPRGRAKQPNPTA